MTLLPFFTYYGGKWRSGLTYPFPLHEIIVEPFAGAAGYSVRYPGRTVILNDIDECVAGTWDYLITAPEEEILALPDLEPGQTTDDLDVPQEARWLIGWWLNKGSAYPKRRPSSFMLEHPAGAPYWGERIRQRIARQQKHIRHWRIWNTDYQELPDYRGTWFIDPPYSASAGEYYRHGRKDIDYTALKMWCLLKGPQAVVCEADDATWLPFRPHVLIDGTEGRQKKGTARLELIWTRGCEPGTLF